MAETEGVRKEPSSLERYKKNRPPLVQMAVWTCGLLILAWWLTSATLAKGSWTTVLFSVDWANTYSTRWLYERHIFILYACAFVAWWVVYLGSRKPNPPAQDARYKQVRSLRRLLGECSVQWDRTDQVNLSKDEIDKFEMGNREKAKSSMTTIAILIMVSATEMQEVSKILSDELKTQVAVEPCWQQVAVEPCWQVVMLVLSLTFSMVAFISYIVSADALDVIFNHFNDDDCRHNIPRYYYQSTINPRYLALISLITSFILLVAYYSPVVGSVSIGLFFVIGYSHWFPNFDLEDSEKTKTSCRLGGALSRFVIILLPILPVLLDARHTAGVV